MNISEDIDRPAPVLDRVNDAIRENPLAAGLIGAGVAWMLFGAKGFGAVGSVAKAAGEKAVSAATSAGSKVAAASSAALHAGSKASSAVKGAASDAIDAVASVMPHGSGPDGETASTAAADAGSAIDDRVETAASSGREYGAAIRSRLSESLERQPLLLGALGLAIGAGIASTFATTQVESEWLGETGASARDMLQGGAEEAKDRARKTVSDLKDEVSMQGLTLEAAKNAAQSVAGKLSNVARSARDSAAQSFKSSTS